MPILMAHQVLKKIPVMCVVFNNKFKVRSTEVKYTYPRHKTKQFFIASTNSYFLNPSRMLNSSPIFL